MSSHAPGPLNFRLNGGTYPPFGVVTATDHGSYVVIATWIFTCVSVLFAGIRVILRAGIRDSQRSWADVGLICTALAFAIAQSATTQESVRHGLGRPRAALSDQQFTLYSTYVYAGQILSVFVFVLSKLSLVIVFNYLNNSRTVKSVLYAFAAFIILWGIADVFSTAFQCGTAALPAPGPRCVDAKALYFTNGFINIASDVFIILLPLFIVCKVKIKPRRKCIILAMFSTRIVVCISVAFQLSTSQLYFSGRDPSWNYLYPCLWNQIATHLAIVTACIPLIKPFLDSLQSSLMDSGIPRNYPAKLTFDLQPEHGVKKSSSRPLMRKALSSAARIGSLPSMQAHNNIEFTEEHSNMANVADNVIHVRRDVDVSIAEPRY